VENFVNVDEETPMNDTIEKFGIFAISVKIATSTSRISENRRISKKENNLVNLRYIGYITANLYNSIPSSC